MADSEHYVGSDDRNVESTRQTDEDIMQKMWATVGSAVFLLIAPGFVAGLMPWWISRWRVEAAFFGMQFFRFAGDVLIALGISGLLDSFVRFAVQGLGTPAPVFPTRNWLSPGCIATFEIQCM
jgi:hypothetical protein